MKAGLADLQEMYANGSLAKNFGTMDYNQITQDVGAGRCGIYFAPRWGAMVPVVDAVKANPEARIVSAKIPEGMGAVSYTHLDVYKRQGVYNSLWLPCS